MPGNILGMLGAGLGMGVNDLIQQRQREQQLALQQLGMQRELAYLNMYLQNQKAQQDAAALSLGLGGGPMAGSTGRGPPTGAGGDIAPLGPQAPPSTGPAAHRFPVSPFNQLQFLINPMAGMGVPTGLPMPNTAAQSRGQLVQAAQAAGFDPQGAGRISDAFLAESGGDPLAINLSPSEKGGSFGAGQINAAHPGAAQTIGNIPRSMQMAYDISKGGTDFSPWHAYKGPGGGAPGGGTQVAQAGPQTATDTTGGEAGQEVIPPIPPPVNQAAIIAQVRSEGAKVGATPQAMAVAAKARIAQAEQERKDQISVITQMRANALSQRQTVAAERQAQQAGVSNAFNVEVTTPDGKVYGTMAYEVKGKKGLYDKDTGELIQGKVRKVSGQQTELPPEIKHPEKWEGMPDKPPPGTGIRQDIWDGALAYVQTGQMPALGLGSSKIRDEIYAAEPAARHALGIQPSGLAGARAAYAGERHGQIVLAGRVANLETSINEAKKLGPAVVTASANVPRLDMGPIFNSWVTGAKLQTGDPNIVAFSGALNAFLNTYARGINPTGRLTDQQQRHAYEVLQTAMSQGQVARGIEQLTYELDIMKGGLGEAVQEVPQMFRPPALQGQPAPTPRDPSLGAPTQQGGIPQPGVHYQWDGEKLVPAQQ